MTTIPLIRASEFAEIYPTLSRESIIDVREEDEYALVHLTHSTLSPLSEGIPQISVRDQPIYILCRSGARSAQVTMELVARGHRAYNIEGGIRSLLAGMSSSDITIGDPEQLRRYLA